MPALNLAAGLFGYIISQGFRTAGRLFYALPNIPYIGRFFGAIANLPVIGSGLRGFGSGIGRLGLGGELSRWVYYIFPQDPKNWLRIRIELLIFSQHWHLLDIQFRGLLDLYLACGSALHWTQVLQVQIQMSNSAVQKFGYLHRLLLLQLGVAAADGIKHLLPHANQEWFVHTPQAKLLLRVWILSFWCRQENTIIQSKTSFYMEDFSQFSDVPNSLFSSWSSLKKTCIMKIIEQSVHAWWRDWLLSTSNLARQATDWADLETESHAGKAIKPGMLGQHLLL